MYRLLLLTLLTGALLAGRAPAADPTEEPIRFMFSPRDGLSYTVVITSKRIRTMGQQSMVEDAKGTTTVTIHRTGTGWSVVSTPSDLVLKKDGVVVDDPVARLLVSTPITYELDREGRLLEVIGFDNIEERILEELPMKMAGQAGPMFDSAFFENRERSEWNNRIGDFIGMQTHIGEVLEHDDTFTLHTGETVHRKSVTTIKASEDCNNHSCVRIHARFTNAKDPHETSLTEFSGTVSRLMDPSTMLIYDEESTRIIKLTVDIPNLGPIPVKMNETRAYKYLYEDTGPAEHPTP